jgi:eukaryotic-like serine/threonine-protein kinase
LIGSVIQRRFRIDHLLGEGGMGAVYAARDLAEDRAVAVKVLTAEAAQSALLVGRFHREARAASAIESPHIARVLDAGTDATGPYLVMELLEGEDAGKLFRRLIQVPPSVALRIAAQTCAGLAGAHATGIVHRDIKPANIFLAQGEGGRVTVKLLDFGIAKFTPSFARRDPPLEIFTRTGAVLGSPLYMSPEQARGSKTIDHRADVWALGVVLYQALAGFAPHQNVEALGELLVTICTESPRPVQEAAPWVSGEVAGIVHRALRLDPLGRFQTANEMLAAIERALGDEAGVAIDEAMLARVSKDERAQAVKDNPEMESPPTVREPLNQG